MDDIGVERGAYHCGSYNGDMAIKVLQNFAGLLEVALEHDEIHHKFEVVFSVLSRLLPLVYTTRFLSPEAVNEEFSDAYPIVLWRNDHKQNALHHAQDTEACNEAEIGWLVCRASK